MQGLLEIIFYILRQERREHWVTPMNSIAELERFRLLSEECTNHQTQLEIDAAHSLAVCEGN